eukprot:jgi/Chrzof1/5587/Cz16g08080.t1
MQCQRETTHSRQSDERMQSDDPEEYYESDSDEEYNTRMFGIYQALPVDGEPDWSIPEPTTAEEYLRRVRHEAAQCPRVVRVEMPADMQAAQRPIAALPEPDAIPDAPDWAKPSSSWVREFVDNFQDFRLQMQQAYDQGDFAPDSLPHLNDLQAWDSLCFGPGLRNDTNLTSTSGSDYGGDVMIMADSMFTAVMGMDQVAIVTLFQRHIDELEQDFPNNLPLLRGKWLFALAARLEKPLQPDVSAALRSLLRYCAKLRCQLSEASDPLLPQLNVLMTVAGAYFGQDEELCKVVDSHELA